MEYTFWIQNSDFTSPQGLEEPEIVTSGDDLYSIFSSFDWLTQNLYEEAQLLEKTECCPAGIGIVGPDSRILHICPNANAQTALVHVHDTLKTKKFGILKKNVSRSQTFSNVPYPMLKTLFHEFIAGDDAAICESLKGYSS